MNKLLLVLVSLAMVLSASSISFAEILDSNTEQNCINNVCTLSVYSGQKFIYEDSQWKRIEDADSLMEIWKPVFVKTDKDYTIDVTDVSYNSITYCLQVDNKYVGMDVPLKYCTDESCSDNKYSFGAGEEKCQKIFISGSVLDYNFTFGFNSTTIIINDTVASNSGDTYIDEGTPASNFGTSAYLHLSNGSVGNAQEILFKFDVSSIPNNATINSSTLYGYISSNGLDSGDVVDGQAHMIYNNYSWEETTPTWNTRPLAYYNTTYESNWSFTDASGIWVNWNITQMTQYAVNHSYANLSIWIRGHYLAGTVVSSDFVTISSEEATNIPYINVTYSMVGGEPPTTTTTSTTTTTLPYIPVWNDTGVYDTYSYCGEYTILNISTHSLFGDFGADYIPEAACLNTSISKTFDTSASSRYDFQYYLEDNWLQSIHNTNRTLANQLDVYEYDTDVNAFEFIPCSNLEYTNPYFQTYNLNGEGLFSTFCFHVPLDTIYISADEEETYNRMDIEGTSTSPAECNFMGSNDLIMGAYSNVTVSIPSSNSFRFYYRLTGSSGNLIVYINDVYHATYNTQTCGWSDTLDSGDSGWIAGGMNEIRFFNNATTPFTRLGSFEAEIEDRSIYGIMKFLSIDETNGNVNVGIGIQADTHAVISDPDYYTSETLIANETICTLDMEWYSTEPLSSYVRYRLQDIDNVYGNWMTESEPNYVNDHHIAIVVEGRGQFFLKGYSEIGHEYVNDNDGNYYLFSCDSWYPEELPFNALCIKPVESGTRWALSTGGQICLDGGCFDANANNRFTVENEFGDLEYYWCAYGYDLGEVNITVNKGGYYPLTDSIDFNSIPYIYTAVLTPIGDCTEMPFFFFNENECLDETVSKATADPWNYNASDITSFYCKYDVSQWQPYLCLGNQTLPSGAEVNGTYYPDGVTPAGSPSDEIDDAIQQIADVLGVSKEAFMLFLAIAASIIVGIAAAAKSKSEVIGALSFIGMLFVFTAFRWVDPIVTLIIAVMAAGIVAYFTRKMTTGG